MNAELGTLENPFENIDDLFVHVLSLEKDLIDNDKYLASVKRTQSVCYANFNPVPSWLWPDVAFMDNGLSMDSFVVNKQRSGCFSFKPVLNKRKLLFRGQTKDYQRCVPTLFRDDKQDYFLDEMILNHEMWCLIESHPLVQLLGINGVKIGGEDFKMRTNYGGLCQHYFNRTRYLDLTSDVDTTKFFACTDFNKNKCSPHTEDGIGVVYCYCIEMPLAFQRNINPYKGLQYHLSTIGKQVFPRSGVQYGYLLDMDKGLDLNDFPNVIKFYFKHNTTISNRIYLESAQGEKYMPPSILDDYWNEKMSSTKTDRQISQNALAINLSYNPNETKSSLSKKLERRGYNITRRVTSFTPDQLSSYFQDIRNGWWQEVFCCNIGFHDDKEGKLKNELLSLCNNPDYAFAFDSNARPFDYRFDLERFSDNFI